MARAGSRASVRPPRIDFEPTYHFEKLRSVVRAQLNELRVLDELGRPSADLRAEQGVQREALLYLLADRECERLGLVSASGSTNWSSGTLHDVEGDRVGYLEGRVAALAERHSSLLSAYTLPALLRRLGYEIGDDSAGEPVQDLS